MDLPEKPDDNDCCNSGCSPCIFDVYEEQVKLYNKRLHVQEKAAPLIKTKNILSQIKYTKFSLIYKETINTKVLKLFFEYCKSDNDENLNCVILYDAGQHFILKAPRNCEDEHFTRAYTPIKSEKIEYGSASTRENLDPKICFQVIVRIYDSGLMSKYLHSLNIGDITYWRGPYGSYKYKLNNSKHILMVSQGTGIAPLYSIANEILNNVEDESIITLYSCFRDMENIFLRDELYNLKSNWNFFYNIFLSEDIHCDCNMSDHSECKGNTLKYKENILKHRLSNLYVDNYFTQEKNDITFMVCGSPIFVNYYRDVVSCHCVDESNIIVFL